MLIINKYRLHFQLLLKRLISIHLMLIINTKYVYSFIFFRIISIHLMLIINSFMETFMIPIVCYFNTSNVNNQLVISNILISPVFISIHLMLIINTIISFFPLRLGNISIHLMLIINISGRDCIARHCTTISIHLMLIINNDW